MIKQKETFLHKPSSNQVPRLVSLRPPLITPNNIKEKIICIRAHRERIFQTYIQKNDTKIICHNYGQGGAGWTFLFGCVNESIRQFENYITTTTFTKSEPICIVGAGCYGLLTAISLAQKGYNVKIVAKSIEDLPSEKAAGFFFPRSRKCSTIEEKALFESRGIESYITYKSIAQGTHPFIKKGSKLLPAYYGLDIDPGFAPYIKQGIMDNPEKVIIDFGNNKTYPAMEYKTIFIDAILMMQELRSIAHSLKINIIHTEINSFTDLKESFIFNCSGLGAKKLTKDTRIIPVQGHLISLHNQSDAHKLQYMLNFKVTMINQNGMPRDELIYYSPKGSGILGITFLRGQDSTTTNLHEFDRLLQRSQDFFGS